MKAFIEQALRDRYDDFVGENEILDEFIDDLVEICTEGGIPEGYTARTIIDNRYVNGERGTYEEYRTDYMNETQKYKGTKKQIEKIEEDMDEHGYYYKTDKEIWTSM
jgi:hypothetical protein